MLILATDYGCGSPYQAQLQLALERSMNPGKNIAILSLFCDLAKFEPKLAAYLLPQYFKEFPADSVLLSVVDPLVGDAARPGLVIRYQQLWIVCAGDELLQVLHSRGEECRAWKIVWQPENSSNSFHGRDVFAPVAAALAQGAWNDAWYQSWDSPSPQNAHWPQDLAQIVYIDSFGNAMTGIRAVSMPGQASLQIGERRLNRAKVFSSVEKGECFFYENANGLIEIAANQASAAKILSLHSAQNVTVLP